MPDSASPPRRLGRRPSITREDLIVAALALLAYAADRAAGKMRVLWGFGVESESELAFAGLHQLARPVLQDISFTVENDELTSVRGTAAAKR